MAEKGGNGSPFPRGKAAAPLKQGSLKGNNSGAMDESTHIEIDSSDSELEGFVEEKVPTSLNANEKSSAEQKSGKKKVSFGSLKSSGKTSFDIPTAKGDLGKGGKGFSVGKAGGKGSIPEATPIKPLVTEVELKLELELPKGARLLMDCEAAEVLQEIQGHMTVLSDDPKIKMPESFSKALQYAKINAHYTNVQSVRQVLEYPLVELALNGVTDGEICMIGNVDPETLDEVYALIPSLKTNKHKNEGAIADVLASLANFRTSK
ncbi:DNA-directed RNA polymerases IV and V subunit 4-like isoform X1 [Musa acuminata AAA Group]|uniref:DNA-directed RNA polymerases IV and V subunit 4-like isoform X1 n=1 Tax=Musa acuminata AAA Group TaxID=214697 RepID=UPI0031DE9451